MSSRVGKLADVVLLIVLTLPLWTLRSDASSADQRDAVGSVTLAGDVTGPSGANTLSTAISNRLNVAPGTLGQITVTAAAGAGTALGQGTDGMLLQSRGAAALPVYTALSGDVTVASGGAVSVKSAIATPVTQIVSGAVLTSDSIQSGNTSFATIGFSTPFQTLGGALQVGSTIEHVMRGVVTYNAADTVQWQLLYGATVIATFNAINPVSGGVGQQFNITGESTVRSTGASGSINSRYLITYSNGNSAVIQQNTTAQPVTCDITTANNWVWQMKFSSSSGTNSMTASNHIIKVIK